MVTYIVTNTTEYRQPKTTHCHKATGVINKVRHVHCMQSYKSRQQNVKLKRVYSICICFCLRYVITLKYRIHNMQQASEDENRHHRYTLCSKKTCDHVFDDKLK